MGTQALGLGQALLVHLRACTKALLWKWGRHSFPWLGNSRRLGRGIPPRSTCRAQLGDSARSGFLVLASFVGPFWPWQPGIMDLTLQQPLYSACADPSTPDSAWGEQRVWFGWVSPAGDSWDWGDLTGRLLCVLSLQPPGAQWDQVHPPGSLLSLQKAS